MMGRTGGEGTTRSARAGEQIRGRPRPYAPARPAKPSPIEATWKVVKPVIIVVGILGVGSSLLEVADGVVRDRNHGSGFLPDFLRFRSSPPDQPYAPASLAAQNGTAQATLPEDRPPVAQGAQLPASQVRWCLSQGIRLQGASRVVNTASREETTRFLVLSDDYDPRCGNYRAAPDVTRSVKAEVESRRAALEHEGAVMIRPSLLSMQAEAVEERPPAAQGAVLRESQVRYCLSQGIRLQGAAKTVNTASAPEAGRFIGLDDDYKQRCENYRVAPGVTRAVKDEVESRRAALEREGATLIRPPR